MPSFVLSPLAALMSWFADLTVSEKSLVIIAVFSVLIYWRLGRIIRIMKTGEDFLDRIRRGALFNQRSRVVIIAPMRRDPGVRPEHLGNSRPSLTSDMFAQAGVGGPTDLKGAGFGEANSRFDNRL